jgi:hypothetical protein
MNTRFDNRSKNTFKKDIYFSTKLEKYFFDKWVGIFRKKKTVLLENPRDNGCGNDGEFIAKGNTAGADYMVDIQNHPKRTMKKDHPLEIKWVPTAGKFTLKENDLKAYIREGASILFIYNSVRCGTDMRKPKDYDLEKHVRLIESKADQIKWGIMWSQKVKDFYSHAKENNLIQPIYYMGGKQGVVLKQEDFDKWFTQENWA